ncbi:MAG: enoyl-CoA hydratase/isomerase family protein [Hyphomonadaceae bacterium]
MTSAISLTRINRAAWITIDRPQKKNAFDADMMGELLRVLRSLEHDRESEVVIIRAVGTDFCSGADVGGLAENLSPPPAARAASFERGIDNYIHPLLRAFLALPQPIVASTRGYVVGLGMQFVLAADLLVASETAKFLLPNVRLGHVTDHGESWLLPRRIGPAKAAQMCLLGESFSATDAERFGLANWLVADAELEAKTDAVVAGLLRGAPEAVRRTKALHRAALQNDLETHLAEERRHVAACAATDDYVEAISAFTERREPRFKGA